MSNARRAAECEWAQIRAKALIEAQTERTKLMTMYESNALHSV